MHVIKNAPTTSKATSGHISAFMNNLVNTTWRRHAVCESCHAQIKYTGVNTTNLRNHVSCFHPELLTLSVPRV